MKKIPKKILGLLGLILVAVMTIVAVALPGTEVLATSSVTDTIVVRVVGEVPNVAITGPEDKSVFVSPKRTISYDYENVKNVKITVDYIDGEGKLHAYVIEDFAPSDNFGSGTVKLDLSDDRFGYGEYVVRIFGEGKEGEPVENAISFSYYPFTAEIEDNEETGNPKVVLDYDDENDDIEKFEINIYDKDGNLVQPSPVTVTPPSKWTDIPFADYNLPEGKYRIEITAYKGSEALHKVVLYYDYKPIPVPDTGSFLRNLNISKADFLISALIIFFAISLGSIVFIVRRKNTRK